ncbi:extracellular solute-binding protein [Paenibacillus sp. IITD108]|uniref:extracellular solute-binding protein n=1 Tax=Paenibacillus sp. IITD108 TaxID=3116649 RepID=UPI002F42482E
MNTKDRQTFHLRYRNMINTLRKEIKEGIYLPGDFLSSETKLMEQFSLGKHSVRSALEELVKEGLIEKIDRVGTRVCYVSPIQTTLRFGVYPSLYEEARLKEVIAMFHQEYPHIKVELIELPYHQVESIKSLTELGIFDVLTVNVFDFNYFKDNDGLALLEEQTVLPNTYPFLNDLFSAAGKGLMLQPFVYSPVILCYNKDHLREQQLLEPDGSWSWDDLHQLLRQLKGINRRGLYFHLFSINRWPIFLIQQGIRFKSKEDGSITIEDPARFCELLQMLRNLIHEEGMYPVGLGNYGEEILFLQEKVSVIISSYFKLNRLKDAEFNYDIAQLPRGKNNATLLLSIGIGIYDKSPQKEAARKLTNFLTSEGVLSYIRETTYSLSANKRIAESVETLHGNKPLRMELYREIAANYATHEQLGLTMSEILILGDCLKQYFSNLIDEDELLAMFSAKINAQ